MVNTPSSDIDEGISREVWDSGEKLPSYIDRFKAGWRQHGKTGKALKWSERRARRKSFSKALSSNPRIHKGVRHGFKARQYRIPLALAGAAATYGVARAMHARRKRREKKYTPAEVRRARWKSWQSSKGGVVAGSLLGVAAGLTAIGRADVLGHGLSAYQRAKTLAIPTVIGGAAVGGLHYLASPGPRPRHIRRADRGQVESLVQRVANGDSVEDVVNCLLNEEFDYED